MKAMAGSAGQTVKTQINRRIIACFWNKGRAIWGDEVELGRALLVDARRTAAQN